MSFTTMSSTNSLAVKRWEMETWLQSQRTTTFGYLAQRGCIFYPQEFKGTNKVGDSVTFAYAGSLIKVPVGEGGTLDGNEESLDLKSHAMVVNVSRIGVLNPNVDTIEQQRTYVKFDEVSKRQLAKRVNALLDTSLMYQLAGAAPTTLTIDGTTYGNATDLLQVQGQNAVVAPTSNRIVRAGNVSADESLTSSNKMTLDLIDIAIESAMLTNQPIDMLDGNKFILVISPEQQYDLMHDSTGKIQWYANALAKAQGGDFSDLEGSNFGSKTQVLGTYRNVDIIMDPRVAYGMNSSTSAVITTVRRALFLGMDAASFASPYGGQLSDDDVPVKFFAQFKDYDYFKGMEARMISGIKKMTPTGKDDIGVIVIASYAAPHSNISY